MGGALTDIDLREVISFHKEKKALATIALKKVSDTSEYGVVNLFAIRAATLWNYAVNSCFTWPTAPITHRPLSSPSLPPCRP
jgi:hypothetical protein